MNQPCSKLTTFFLTLIIGLLLCQSRAYAKGLSPIDGTFFPAHLAVDFSEEQWSTELAEWEEMGLEYVVIGESAIRNQEGQWETYYPSQYANHYYYNSVETILQHCETAGIKCFVACGNYDDFHSINICRHDQYDASGHLTVRGQESFFQLVSDTLPFMQELYDLYGTKYPNSFYGFYFVPEVSNSIEFEQADTLSVGITSLSGALNLTIEQINQLNPDLKLLLSPYANLKKEAAWNTHDPKIIEQFWTGVLQQTAFRTGDILSPQDSVGANGVSLSQLADITCAYRNAVDSGNKGVLLWSNCETFLFPLETMDCDFEIGQSAYTNRLISQMDIVSPYVDKIITCSYTNYIGSSNCGDSFYRTYRDYLLTGCLDSTPPEPITQVSGDIILVRDRPVLRLTCDPIADEYGVARMEITKYGNPYTFRVATRYTKNPTLLNPGIAQPSSFYDEEFSLKNDFAIYGITLIDCAGNRSEEVIISVSSVKIRKQEITAPYSTNYALLHRTSYDITCQVYGSVQHLFRQSKSTQLSE